MNIQCPNPECRADNPANAKFCRKCGTKLNPRAWDLIYIYLFQIIEFAKKSITNWSMSNSVIREFTLDKFKEIPLHPVSIVPIRFINKFWLIVGILLTISLLSFYCISDVRYFFKDLFGEYDYYTFRDILPIAFIPLVMVCLSLIISIFKKFRFRLNADYIEKTFVSDLSRIAKDCKLGLFNNKNKRIILSSRYDSIEKFDANHLIIERNGKKGLFSIARKKIIIPVLFDSISNLSNSVATATNGSIVVHYDVKGNKLK